MIGRDNLLHVLRPGTARAWCPMTVATTPTRGPHRHCEACPREAQAWRRRQTPEAWRQVWSDP